MTEFLVKYALHYSEELRGKVKEFSNENAVEVHKFIFNHYYKNVMINNILN